MADTRLTKVKLLRVIYLCILGAFCPGKLVEAEFADEEVRNALPQPPPPEKPRAYKVTRALWASLAWVMCSIAVGYLSGRILNAVFRKPVPVLVKSLQIAGATLLLWATLAVRGWDILSFGGVTLTERVNRWIFRFQYCLGTVAIVASLVVM